MPGIAGIIRLHAYEGVEDDLRLMTDAMRHNASYLGGQYTNSDLGIYISWLSHPHSMSSFAPIFNRDKTLTLLIVGEHFAGPQSAITPNDRGCGFGQELVRLYEQSKETFLRALNGWFSGLVVDANRREVTLFNDRYGMSRIYLHQGRDEFIFASEAKALLRIRPFLREIDPASLAQYLRYNCVPGNKSLFKGVSLLPPASSWVFSRNAGPQKLAYFDFVDWEQQPAIAAEEFHHRFEHTVSNVFPAYMRSPERVGLSLTAGLDTRAILVSALEKGERLPCYTFGGLWGETFDVRTARKLAGACGLPHETITINERFLQDLPFYARRSVYISDGTHDALHGAHDVYFNQVAKNIAPVRLTGKFGSEVVRVRKLISSGDFPREMLQPGFVPFLDSVPSLGEIHQKTHPLTRVVAEDIGWYEFGRISVEQSEVIMRTPYMDNDLVKLMYQVPSALRGSRDLQARYILRNQRLSQISTNMGAVREGSHLTSKIAYALYWALFKAEFIYLYATPHWATRLDRQFESLRPERFISGRQKFEAYRIWIKTHLSEFVRELLLNPAAHCTTFFDKKWVEKIVMRHTAGTHNYLDEINKILTVELVCASLLSSQTTTERMYSHSSSAGN